MFFNTNDKYFCCGCTACTSVCPTKCISMAEDEEGFLYPIKDVEKCVDCGICERVCPFNSGNERKDYKEPLCYYGWHKSEKIRLASTSGAAFVAASQSAKKLGFNYFSGVIYDELTLNVKHTLVNDLSEISSMTTSKYVQSDLGNIFLEIKELLVNGNKVLFSGTPCQVDGLQRYVGPKYRSNLLTLALVCHGVSSPKCFDKYKKSVERKYSSGIKSIRFRDKREYKGKLLHTFTTVELQNSSRLSRVDNPYTTIFGLGLINRPSCFNCPFTTPIRNADLTIGDFWGIADIFPELEGEVSKGISLILAHSEEGKQLVDEMGDEMHLVKLKDYKMCVNARNQQLSKPYLENSKRKRFIQAVLQEDADFIKESNKILIPRKIENRMKSYYGAFLRSVKKLKQK